MALALKSAGAQDCVYPVGNADVAPHPGASSLSENGYRVTRGYQETVEGGTQHTGVDLASGTEGGDVRAIAAGTVTEVRLDPLKGFGNVVRIWHEALGVYSQYGHLMNGSIAVTENQPISVGQIIGRVDCSGYTKGASLCPSNGKYGPHLHLSLQTFDSRGCGYLPDSACPNLTFADYRDPLLAIATCRAGHTSFDDDFNDNALDLTRWRIEDPPPPPMRQGVVTETNQRLEVSTAGSGPSGAGILSVWYLQGDFDVQVDFQLFTWPAANTNSVILKAVDVGLGQFGGIDMSRHSSRFFGESYVMVLADEFFPHPTGDLSGKLRLTRSGTTLSGFYHNGSGWVFAGAGPVPAVDTRISLEFGSSDPAALSATAAFDNFKVN